MKKIGVIALLMGLFILPLTLSAQMNEIPFFDSKGNVNIATTELDTLADTIAVTQHRRDDIVWSRVVYRVIDMRDKQNYQLYFPTRPNKEYRNLFTVMIDAICDGVNVYKKNPRDIKPEFDELLEGEELSRAFAFDEDKTSDLIQVDSVTKQRTFNNYRYMQYVRNQLKFLIQEIIFFDKHTSRMYSKIIGIAPLYALHPDNVESKETMGYFRGSVICWFAYDELRPYLAKQYAIPNGNDTQRMTFDDFFSLKLYASYLLGDSNMFSRMLLDYVIDPAKVRKEQNRIDNELLNFEQDLWEY
ncbi:MAG: gliding motility protein GldN [Paludibacteraceae bacterium]|nr:gliding motility protein GldN [Paludibacteraceae bacterium]